MEILSLFVAFITAFAAAFVGTNAGGGSLITVPVLILLGLPPHIAVGSNRLGVVATAASGMARFHRDRLIRFDVGFFIALCSSIGAYLGANMLLQLPEEFLRKLIGIFVLIVFFIVLVRRNHGVKPKEHVSTFSKTCGYVMFLLIGFVAALFGGGGVFSRMTYTTFFGMTYLEAAGTAKIATLSLSIVASAVFIHAGVVNYHYALALMLGGSLGSYIGAHYGISKGNEWVRKLFMAVVLVSALRLLV